VDRVKETFASIRQSGRTGLVTYITSGFPSLEITKKLIPTLVRNGADIIELGIPFSDPLADGPVIQESTNIALENGVTIDDCLNIVAAVRKDIPDTPLILMGYYNPIFNYGISAFASKCSSVGVDGLIVVDLPWEEIAPLQSACLECDIHIIPLLAPTSAEDRIADTLTIGSGFIYCVSVNGVTGSRQDVSNRGLELIHRVKSHTSLPLAVGFGISSREHVLEVCNEADAAVVGSALIRTMLDSPDDKIVENVADLVSNLSGRKS